MMIKFLNRYNRTRNIRGYNVRSNTMYIKGTKNASKKIEIEEEESQLNYLMKNSSPTDKKLITSHRKKILKFLHKYLMQFQF